jgi:glutamate synthase (NADPH/NADH) small chain
MGKPTGFLEFKRELPTDIAPKTRVKNWEEFHEHFADQKLQDQGARCMNCGVPFCHTGNLVSGMASGCPINNLIPEWNDLIYNNQWEEAAERLFRTNNFPEFTGRVCPAPCEGSCVLGINEPPVTIKNIEYSIIEHAFEKGWVKPNMPKLRTGKKVAVIGSGPSGLSAASQLNLAGHTVTVFERADRIGGLLMYGIPNMKLDKKKVVERRVELMKIEGITFKTGVEVGKDIPAEKLQKDFDAVVICTGATKPRDLQIEGRDLKGIHMAMEFLSKNTKSLLDSNHKDGNYISAKDKHVVVIGGGDTGTDCVGTSLRHGCKSVTQLEIMPKPPTERAVNNPWPEWPKTYKLDYGQEEAKDIYGSDPRQYCVQTKKFIGDDKGNLTAMQIVQIEWKKNDKGQMTPVEIAGTEKTIPADLVLLALGFLGPEETVPKALGLKQDPRSNVDAPYGLFTTNVKGVFAAGDARRGQSLVVWAINEGRAAARECDRYLMGTTQLP